jgi:N-acetylneuraminic acid mutarotase
MKTLKSEIRVLKVLFLLSFIISLTSASFAAEEIWTIKADMPTARMLLDTCVVDGKIYAIGGCPAPHVGISAVEVYDPKTDTWTRKTRMPTSRGGLGICAVDGKIYAIGGLPLGARTVEEYDPETDTWKRKADMPTARGFLSTSVVNGKIYAIGGATDTSGPAFTTVEQYDPVTDTWTHKADMPEPRFMHTAGVVDGKIYVIAGSWQSYTSSTAVFAYDPVTNTWETKADAPTARSWLSPTAGVADGRIYVMGGDFGTPKANVEEYDPVTDTWTIRTDMPTPRGALSTVALNDKIYVVGGTVTLFNDVLSTVEEYFPNPLIVDFNGDGIVNTKEILRLIESWGQDDPMCDVAPHPSGDGVVDALDLELLMSYWGQPIDDPLLLSHWTFDETEGMIAYDNAGISDAYLMGEPVWQSDAGMVGGALMFDGVNDYAVAPVALSPADGPFSVFAWIKGGAPGQVIFSQSNGANWLMTDSDFGCLTTELMPPAIGRFVAQPLKSETIITDDKWHRIGFVWDGINRALYVDDILVAEDAQEGLADCSGALNIGCGNNSTAGTFWSGLIDDVRIYNRVVKP